MEEAKEKKTEENKRHILKIKEKRQANEQFNDKKDKKNKKRRQRRLFKLKMERENGATANDSATKRKTSTKKGLRLKSEKGHKDCVTVFREIQKVGQKQKLMLSKMLHRDGNQCCQIRCQVIQKKFVKSSILIA